MQQNLSLIAFVKVNIFLLFYSQEIIKIYKIAPPSPKATSSSNTLGNIVYSKLPSNVQEMLKPLQNSKYIVLQDNRMNNQALPCPLYKSKYSKNFNRWVTAWSCSLIELLCGDVSKPVSLLISKQLSILCICLQREYNFIYAIWYILSFQPIFTHFFLFTYLLPQILTFRTL